MNATINPNVSFSFSRLFWTVGLLVAALAGAFGIETALAADDVELPTARITVENDRVTHSDALVRVANDGEGAPFYDTRGPDAAPVKKYTRTGTPDANDPAAIKQKIAFRYSNPEIVRFGRSLNANAAIGLYREATQLIDSRHIAPTAYAERSYRGLRSLSLAVGTAEFQSAYGVNLNESQVYRFRQSLNSLAANQPRNSSEALNVLYGAMNLANNQLRLPPQAVVLEFVYAATESLDKYSAFLPSANKQGAAIETEERSANGLEDHIVGIGVEIKAVDEGILVERVLRNGPAQKGGLQAGDVIVSVNGRSMVGATIDMAVDGIAGPAGSRVLLGVNRDGRTGMLSMVRARVELHSVSEFRMADAANKVGYIKLDKFTEKSAKEMDEALWSLYNDGMKSLVIDVRGNPGGLLTTAIELSDKFLPCGDIVSTRGRNLQDNTKESARFDRTWSLPLVVLVDENSASASEIFAAAIQDNARGLVVGTKSYGKGTVQTHFPLQSVSGNLKLTTAYFYSPSGRKMAGEGVTPDITVEAADRFSRNGDTQLETAVKTANGTKANQLAESAAKCRN